jgi:HJR/Mrr/RecB family endonuclease
MGKALSSLALVAIAAAALLVGWIRDNPLLAAVLIPSVVGGIWWLVRAGLKVEAETMDAKLRDEHVPSMSPLDYERFAARLLERAGWKVRHIGAAGDQGCDVLAEFAGEHRTSRAVIQCKLYSKPCGNAGVASVVAARRHYDAQVMAVVCPAGYTASARALARTNGVHLLHHNDLPKLAAVANLR